ncbi:hypothetical protein HDU86_005769 [Geranomyces michiganensis]|nr:hypothetical protein HDU86_005769 [Geranomyces michiganensis]
MHHSLLHRPHRPRIHRRPRASGAARVYGRRGLKTPTSTPLPTAGWGAGSPSTTAAGNVLGGREDVQHSRGETKSSHRPWSARPLPPPIGIEKLKDHDGPSDETQEHKSYASADTNFPSLSVAGKPAPTAGTTTSSTTADRVIKLRVQPSATVVTTSTTAELQRAVLRELVAWYFYARGANPQTLSDTAAPTTGGSRGVNALRPVKSMLVVGGEGGAAALSSLAEDVEEEAAAGVDVWKGIGVKGFTFALSGRGRRSVGKDIDSSVQGVGWGDSKSTAASLPPPPPHTATAPQARTGTSHRARRVSLSTGLLLMSPSSTDLDAAPAQSAQPTITTSTTRDRAGSVAVASGPPRSAARRRAPHDRPRRFPASFGTALGPWVSHDPDLCDAHEHGKYHELVAGSPAAYDLERAKGWTSHERIKSFVWDVATAEGGDTDAAAGKRVSFSGLFERLLLVDPKDRVGAEKIALGKKIAEGKRRENVPLATVPLATADSPPRQFMYVLPFTNIQNAAEVKQLLMAGDDRVPQMALVDASNILDIFQLQLACTKALLSQKDNTMTTRTLYAEILFNLCPTNKISEAFRKFGIADTSRAVHAIMVGAEPPSKETQHLLTTLIKGTPAGVESVPDLADAKAINKTFKLGSEQRTRSETLSLVIGTMALKGILS